MVVLTLSDKVWKYVGTDVIYFSMCHDFVRFILFFHYRQLFLCVFYSACILSFPWQAGELTMVYCRSGLLCVSFLLLTDNLIPI